MSEGSTQPYTPPLSRLDLCQAATFQILVYHHRLEGHKPANEHLIDSLGGHFLSGRQEQASSIDKNAKRK